MAAPPTASQDNSNSSLIPGVCQKMSIKIGRNAAELAKPCFTAGTSRVARSRATKALGLRGKRKAISPQSPPSPNQESAVNPRTGKVAFGPWLGPYETHIDGLASGPLFLDHKGNTYASLNAAGYLKGVTTAQQQQAQPPPQTSEDKGSAAGATQQLYAMVNKAIQSQAAMAQARKPVQWRGQGKPHGSGRCGSSMARAINQPRRC